MLAKDNRLTKIEGTYHGKQACVNFESEGITIVFIQFSVPFWW